MLDPIVRLLHISDLHIDAEGNLEPVTVRGDLREIAGAIQRNRTEAFLKNFDAMLHRLWARDQWPKAVLVSGDLVNYGRPEEFAKAREFLKDLAGLLHISPKDVYVVPGNHDVDWSPRLSRGERFRSFFAAMDDAFTAPCFVNDEPHSLRVNLHNLSEGVDVELLLLISPTFSGTVDPHAQSLYKLLGEVMYDATEEQLTQIRKVIYDGHGPLDIAAIGAYQRRQIDEFDQRHVPVRIALMHHHLLPDPQIEASPFEAVLDAGPVIEQLLPRFDLVLTGHKHYRRLVQFKRREEYLDVYSAPSLFVGHENGTAGFTVINLHGPNNSYYASLDYYDTVGCQFRSTEGLVRQGRVLPTVSHLCAQLSPGLQERRLIPILEPFNRSLAWSDGHVGEPIFDKVWERLVGEIAQLGEQKLVFRPPQLYVWWQQLIELAAKQNSSELRLVSKDDLNFWRQAQIPRSDADWYEAPVRDYAGPKSRILILRRNSLRDSEEGAKAMSVINSMVNYGMKIMVVWKEELGSMARDFGIIGSFAVSRFIDDIDAVRYLEESFNSSDLNQANDDWEKLKAQARWWSGEGVNLLELV